MRVSRGFGRRTEARRSPRDDRGGAGCCDGDECAQRRPDGGGRECRVLEFGGSNTSSPVSIRRGSKVGGNSGEDLPVLDAARRVRDCRGRVQGGVGPSRRLEV